jgi:hypothetical protein
MQTHHRSVEQTGEMPGDGDHLLSKPFCFLLTLVRQPLRSPPAPTALFIV